MVASAGVVYVTVRPDTSQFGAQTTSAISTRLSSIGKSITSAGKKLTTGLTLPIVAAGAAAVHLSTDFQASMEKIHGLVGISQSQVNQWSDQILALSGKVAQAPQDLADGMFFVTSAGFKGAAAMKVLTASAKGASAGLGDVKTVADAVTSAVNAYGIHNLSASQAVDTLTASVRLGKVAAADLAPVLGRVIPIAASMGVSFADVGAGMASLTRQGFSAANAATGVKAIMTSLLKPTSAQADAFKKAGFSAEGLRKAVDKDGLLNTLLKMKDAVHGDSAAMAQLFPNVRALAAVMALTGKNAKANIDIFKQMADVTGENTAAFQSAAETNKFQLEASWDALKAALITFGDILAPLVVKVASFFSGLVVWLSKLSPSAKNLVIIGLAIAAALGPVLIIVGSIVSAIGALIPVFAAVAGAIGPILIVGAALAAAAFLIIKNWSTVKSVLLGIWNAVKPSIMAVGSAIMDVWRNNLQPAFKSLQEAFVALEPALMIIGKVIGVWIVGSIIIFLRFTAIMIRVLGVVVQVIAKVVQWVAQFIGWIIRGGEAVAKFLAPAFRVLAAVVVAVFNVIKAVAIPIWNVIVAAVRIAFAVIGAIVRAAWAVFVAVWHGAGAFFSAAFSAVKTIVVGVFNAIKVVAVAVWKVISGAAKIAFAIILFGLIVFFKAMGAIWRAIKPIVLPVWRAIEAAAKTAWHAIQAVWRVAVAFFRGVWNGIKAIAAPVWNGIKVVVVTVWHAIQAAWRGAKAFFGTIWKGIMQVARPVWNGIKGVVIGVWHAIRAAWGGVVGFFSGIWNGIVSAAHTAFSAFVSLWNNTIGAVAHGQSISAGPLHMTLPDLTISGFAEGGIVLGPTLAMIGERGPEAVIPLDSQEGRGRLNRGGRIEGRLVLEGGTAYVDGVLADHENHYDRLRRMSR